VRECQERFQEFTLLQTWGSELCQTIVGPLRVRGHLSEGMWIVALHNTEMAEQLAVFWVVVSSATEFMPRRSPNETLWVEVVNELVVKF
jgi:hypothetical protein